MSTKINRHNFTTIKNENIFDIAEQRIYSGPQGSTVIIPHVCNNIGVFGGGFTGSILDRYPIVKINFDMLGNQPKLGHTQFVTVKTEEKYRHKLIFANMIAQNKTIGYSNARPLNYAALVKCMSTIKTFIENEMKNQDSSGIEIHAPKFGSGLAGGNWLFISDLIDDIWKNTPIYIYTLK